MRLDTAGELCALIAASSAKFKHINVVSALRELLSAGQAGAPRGAVAAALQTLEKCALEQLEDFGPQQVAGTLHILAKKRQCPRNHDFLAQLDAQLEEVASECTPQNVANALWVYATMRRKPEEGALVALEARLESVARECTPQAVENALWAYATMGREPGGRVLGVLEARLESVARKRNSQVVAKKSGRMRRWGGSVGRGRWGRWRHGWRRWRGSAPCRLCWRTLRWRMRRLGGSQGGGC